MTKSKPDFINNPLSILCSCRLRLTAEQRETLKAAHHKFRAEARIAAATPVVAGSTLTVETNTEVPDSAYAKYGLSSLILNDLIVSRDSVSLPIVLNIQKLLNTTIITKEQLTEAFSSYLDYCYSK